MPQLLYPKGKAIHSGYNNCRPQWGGCRYFEHAEMSVVKKLKPIKKKKKIDIVVIRVTKSGKLANSKPCDKCISNLQKINNYVVDNVYYTTVGGTIIKQKFNILAKQERHITRRFR